MKDIQQLIKKNSQEGRYEDIFPKTFIDAVEDRESGNNLTEILSGFNMYFLSYNGSREQTRLQVPMSIRKTGLWITYVLYDKTVVTEWYAGEAIDDNSWKNLSNWRVGSNMLVGDISISSDGYWVVNGVVTTTKAQGEQGITPMLRVGSNNHLQVSYTNGSSWVDASTSPVYTQFRINNNKLEQSVDLGQTWAVVSDYIASWFRFTGTSGSSQTDVGKIQISRDNGVTWSDLSGEFTNSLHIKGYVATIETLPSSAVQGDIYGVGPTYDPSDTEQTNPIYQLYVKDSTGWVNNGRFTSIAAGIVQGLGNSETAIVSQKGVTDKFTFIDSKLFTLPENIPSYYTDELNFRYWIRLTSSPEKGSICRLTFQNMPTSITSIGISTVKDIGQVLDYPPFHIEGNQVFFTVTEDNILYIRLQLSATLTGTVQVDISGKYAISNYINKDSVATDLLSYRTMLKEKYPPNQVRLPSSNIYWITTTEPMVKNGNYAIQLETNKVVSVQVATDYGTDYIVSTVPLVYINGNTIYFTLNYDNITNIRIVVTEPLSNNPVLIKVYADNFYKLNVQNIPIMEGSIASIEARAFSSNILPIQARFDANTVFSANYWYVFRTAIATIVDNYIQVVAQGSIIYEGLRYDTINPFKGKKISIRFQYRNISNTTQLFMFFSGTAAAYLYPTDEWQTFEGTFDYLDSYDRIQICTPNGTPVACTYALKDISIIDLSSQTLESRIDSLENSSVISPLKDKNIAIIGDSISTINGNNTPYFTIQSIDVGEQIQSYVTWWDVWTDSNGTTPTNKTIGGVALTSAMIGTLQTFTPVSGDIGKSVGTALNYNTTSTVVWSQKLCDLTGGILLSNASWSGSRITQRSAAINQYTLSHAWSDYTIGRCRNRDNNGNYINPDIIIIYRGTNDFSHSPYASIDDYDMSNGIPPTDLENGVYNFRKGYELTIQKLREAYPSAYIICCTLNVFKRITYDKFPTRNGQYTLPQMNDVIRDIANTMGCGLIEFDKDGITFENCYPTYISDSATIPTHPNTTGHAVMADKANSDTRYILK